MAKYAKFTFNRVLLCEENECWPWTGHLNQYGYGMVTHDGKARNASRAAFIEHYGYDPVGLVVCHKCDNPICCNPNHLFAATQAENLKDCRDKGRAVYRRGERHTRPTAKLTPEIVADAKDRYFNKGESQSSIARSLGVNSGTISRAVRSETWPHVA